MNCKSEMMKKVQQSDFEVTEANLYLDAYPDSAEALRYFEKAVYESECARKEYEQNYGPLTVKCNKGDTWNWCKTYWPWEIEG